MTKKAINSIVVYQAKSGAIELQADYKKETIWANINDIAELFGINKSNVSRHISNIFEDKEIVRNSTVAKFATVRKSEGSRVVVRKIEYYSLDIILAVGYRARSARRAIDFRRWASIILKQYITGGFAINRARIAKNYDQFLKAVEDVKKLLPAQSKVGAQDILELVRMFAGTWFSLDAYDKSTLPTSGISKKQVQFAAEELEEAIAQLKKDLLARKEATELFGQERQVGHLAGIVGTIFQSAFEQDAYPTLEEKAAHLLYFIVKNHPFTDGNKRSGAFALIWFLRKAGLLRPSLTPEALTALTLLVAESPAKEKDRIIGLLLVLLNGKYKR